MKKQCLTLLVLLALAPVAAADSAARCWGGRIEAASRYVGHRDGRVAFALRDLDGRVWQHHGRDGFRTASLLKTYLLLGYLRRGGVRGRPLQAWERALLGPMIRRSSNEAANRMIDLVGAPRIRRTARAAAQREFRLVLPVWGLTRTSAIDQVRLYERLDRLLPRRHRGYARRLLATIVPSQRWGMPHAVPHGWRILFKGGWGAGTGEVVSQGGRIERGAEDLALAVMTEDNPDHDYGAATIAGVTRRLLRGGPCR